MNPTDLLNHAIFNVSLTADIEASSERIIFGMGCFWGAERCFWQLEGVLRTAVGYAAGTTTDPSYTAICSGNTGHAEVVEVIFNPTIISTEQILRAFWENHDPTQGMRQGNDRGSQYRSVIICSDEEQLNIAEETKKRYQTQLTKDGNGDITTELLTNVHFYLAEEDHQQYLHKNPSGYCGLGGTGSCL